MLRTAGFEPSVNNYAALVRALLLSRDVISATEVLQEMDRVGITFTHTIAAPGGGTRSVFNERQYLTLKALLVEALAARPTPESGDDRDQQFFMAKQLIDTLYTALAEQARAARNADGGSVADFVPAPTTGGTYGDDTVAEASLAAEEEMTGERSDGEKMTEAAADADGPTASVDAGAGAAVVPRIVLDALVEASGNLGMADRAFAIFQDYHSLFDVTPDIHSYNSLLTACAKQRKVNMNAIFTVFQELEASCPSRCDDDMEYSYNNQQQQDISQTQDAGAVGGVEAGMEGEGQERAVVDAEVPSPPAPVSKANGQSFSILFEAMTACRDLRVFDQVYTVCTYLILSYFTMSYTPKLHCSEMHLHAFSLNDSFLFNSREF